MKLRLFGLAALLACGVNSGPGELGVLTFEPASGTIIAVGAQFVVTTNKPADLTSADTALAASPASPRWKADSASAVFEAKAAGTASIIANAPDGGTKALDFINVDLQTPDDLSIVDALDGGAFNISNELKAVARHSGVALHGDYGCTWTVSDPGNASISFGSGVGFAPWFWVEDTAINTATVSTTKLITITATCLGLTHSVIRGVALDAGTPTDASIADAAVTDAADASDAGDASD